MSDAEDDKLEEILKTVNSIHRGVYGDPENKVLGLIDHRKDHEKRITNLEDTRKKALWYGSGALLALNAAYHFIKDKIL